MSFENDYYCLKNQIENTIIINKSKFITNLQPICNYDDAMNKYRQICKKYNDATHNCYAFISNEIATEQRFSDNGEPQGTAGVPMLEVLKKRKVYMTLAVVTRYFGGVKLGAGGLVNAYSDSVAQGLDNAQLLQIKATQFAKIMLDYGHLTMVEDLIKNMRCGTLDVNFLTKVEMNVAIPIQLYQSFVDKIVDITLGKVVVEKKHIGYFGFD